MTAPNRHRVVTITGASRGLGEGMARRCLDLGISVALCARSLPPFDDSDRCLSRSVDVTDGDAVQRFCTEAAERFGHIDLWINNAGVLEPIGPLRDNDPAAWQQHLAVNVLGVFHGSQAYARHLHDTRHHDGVLVNISSGAARSAYAGWSAYCAAKAAVDRMSECLALEEGAHGLRVHAVAPGIIDTDMQSLIRASSPEQFPMVHKFLDLKKNERFSTPEFVADQILSLAFEPEARTDEVLVSLRRP
jgi:NAD(P)-dependent dehydrogenase (short-subunit alcohol dehydrogenase family)